LLEHFLEFGLVPHERFRWTLGWDAVYTETDEINGGRTSAAADFGFLVSEQKFEWHQAAKDPIEALAQYGRNDIWQMKNRLKLGSRLEAVHMMEIDWYRMDSARNKLTGSPRLGHNVIHDAGAEFVLWREPLLSVNYHYRKAHWNKAFDGAETQIGYLSDEQTHYGGLYTEWRIKSWAEVSGAVTRGSDRKRHVDYMIWNFESRVWLADAAKLTFNYEYDVGDSGTGGSGNSQIFTSSATVYF